MKFETYTTDFNRVHVDVETFSECNLKISGAARYAEDPTTRLLVMRYSFNDGPIKRYIPQFGFMHDYSDMPGEILDHIVNKGYKLVAFNLFFEWNIFKHVLGITLDFRQCYCSQAQAAYNALPLDLYRAGVAIGLEEAERKDKAAGTRLINLLCSPDKNGEEYAKPDREEKLQQLDDYCEQDVFTERLIFELSEPLPPSEYRIWLIDQRMNARGIQVDVNAAMASIQLRDKIVKEANDKLVKLTQGKLKSTEPIAAKKYLKEELDYPLDSFAKETLIEVMKDSHAPDKVKQIVQIRQDTGRTSLTKYDRILKCVGADNRLRGMLQYHAAAPGRWGGRLLQPQNLPRPSFDETDLFIENMLTGDHDINELIFGSLFEGLQTCIRAHLVATQGKTLFISDYSAIEARVLAWLANEEGVLEVFRTHGRIYEHTASLIYKKHIDDVTYDERFVGKTGNLSLGFQGGAQAYIKMCAKYGVDDVSYDYAEKVKEDWREANPNIVALWAEADAASKAAVTRPNKVFPVYGDGHRFGRSSPRGIKPKFAYCFSKGDLKCKLPSGRRITYKNAEINEEMLPWGKLGQKINYWGLNSTNHQWSKQDLYGGRAAHNATQGTARDIMANALINIDSDPRFSPLLSVHDEIISEGSKDVDMQEYDDLLLKLPHWAKGLPVACKGEKAFRYGK